MPYKDPEKRREAARLSMQKKRSGNKGLTSKIKKTTVNPLNPLTHPISKEKVNKISIVKGEYQSGYWEGICPICSHHNRMDPGRSFRPVEKCNHFIRLEESGKASQFVFKGLTQNVNPKVNPVDPLIPVNPAKSSYLLSYSRNKYQFVLYHIASEGKRNIVKSCTKGEKIVLGSVELELTWGPEIETIKEASN